jgi:GNAT superfamily N-acetyltransferase
MQRKRRGRACQDLTVTEIQVRAPVDGDIEAMSRVVDAQDVAWWGQPDGDIDDLRLELERVRLATGSIAAGARVALAGGRVVGVALLVGHGHSSLAVDASACDASACDASTVRRALIGWLTDIAEVADDGDVQIESPAQDADRLSDLAAMGFVRHRSSFELERSGVVADLAEPAWPDGIVAVPFRLGVDDEELHEMIYSFWTDVPGHTYRPLDEWRSLILAGPWFETDLVVVARTDAGAGPIVGCSLGRTFTGDVGWVSQLGVAHGARGLGLGRAVLIEACRRLGGRQPRIIGLGVEAENANALGLYRSVGFDVAREWIHCMPVNASAAPAVS